MFKKEKNKVAQGGYGGYVNLSEKNIQFYKETTEIDPLKNFEVALSDGEKVDIETLVTSLSQKTDEKGLKKELEGKNSAQKALLRTAYDLGSSIQEFLAEHTKNEATWEKIMDDLVFYSQEIAGELVTKVKNIGKK